MNSTIVLLYAFLCFLLLGLSVYLYFILPLKEAIAFTLLILLVGPWLLRFLVPYWCLPKVTQMNGRMGKATDRIWEKCGLPPISLTVGRLQWAATFPWEDFKHRHVFQTFSLFTPFWPICFLKLMPHVLSLSSLDTKLHGTGVCSDCRFQQSCFRNDVLHWLLAVIHRRWDRWDPNLSDVGNLSGQFIHSIEWVRGWHTGRSPQVFYFGYLIS